MMKRSLKKMMKKTITVGLIAALAVMSLAACGGDVVNEGGGIGESDINGSVVIAGSTSVQPLSEVLAAGFEEDNMGVTVDVQGGGSGQGIKAIEQGIADIGALSRNLKDEEKSSVGQEIVIAMDGIAVIVNAESSVTELTVEQIKQIYTGEITNWSEVGGDDAAITVVTREEGSGTRGAFTEITGVLSKDDAGNEVDGTTIDALVQPSTGAVKSTVSSTPGTIGYISLGALDDMVKAVKVGGVEATVDNVLSGEYTISRPFIYVTGAEVSDAAQAYIDYVLSDVGQLTVEENGFIPVN